MAEPGGAEESRGGPGIQVITRAAEILRALTASPGGLSQAELADRLGLARTTVHRIVGALEGEGLVSVSHSRGRYRLGPEVTRMTEAVRRDLLGSVHPVLEEISHELHETVDLSVLDGGRATFLDQVVAPHRLQAVSAVGESFPLHACAPGKAILAALPPRELPSILPQRLPGLTPHTITTLTALRTELAQVRHAGVAFDREEHTVGICAVAVVLDPRDSRPMAISLPMPAQRFYGREDELSSALLGARERILDAAERGA
jgi:DNA-binding IclR family transcriptional regulator